MRKVSNGEWIEGREHVQAVSNGESMDKTSVLEEQENMEELKEHDLTRERYRELNKLKKKERSSDQKRGIAAFSIIGLLGLFVGAYFIMDIIKTPESATDNSAQTEWKDKLSESNKETDIGSVQYENSLEKSPEESPDYIEDSAQYENGLEENEEESPNYIEDSAQYENNLEESIEENPSYAEDSVQHENSLEESREENSNHTEISTNENEVITKRTDTSKQLYRVQAGTFSSNENALALKSSIQERGFGATVRKNGEFYIVQVGAFSVKENAEKQLAELQSLGFDGFIRYQ